MRKYKGIYQMTSTTERILMHQLFHWVSLTLKPEEDFSIEYRDNPLYVAGINIWFYSRYIMNKDNLPQRFIIDITDGKFKVKDICPEEEDNLERVLDICALIVSKHSRTTRSFKQLCDRLKIDKKTYKRFCNLNRHPFEVEIRDNDLYQQYWCGFDCNPMVAFNYFIHTGWKISAGLDLPEEDNSTEVNFGTISEDELVKMIEEREKSTIK